jgi:alkaline phosphatase D
MGHGRGRYRALVRDPRSQSAPFSARGVAPSARQRAEKPAGVSRRAFLGAAAGLGLAVATPRGLRSPLLVARDAPRLSGPAFTLGVASGDPLPGRVVLWTRLAPEPQTPTGGMPAEPVSVRWQVARDEAFGKIVRQGKARAEPDAAHSVHVDVAGLEPATDYFYRFIAAGEESPVGRTRTAPAPDASTRPVRFAFASCQQYEEGYFTAHRHLAEEDVDLVAFLGDYIYEDDPSDGKARRHEASEPTDLAGYRLRYATYKADADLQAAHAAHPWAVIWDDHEVENNYAADRAQRDTVSPAEFLTRRAAAYRSWWEHQPVRLPAPTGPDVLMYRTLAFGRLATFQLLDTRQYRTDQACGSAVDIGAPCPDVDSPDATLLGDTQSRWLSRALDESRARWNLIAQQVMVGPVNFAPTLPDGGIVNLDQWDGYTSARGSLVKQLAKLAPNPVVLTGDIHSSWVHDLVAETNGASGTSDRVVATELVGTSITSSFPLESVVQGAVASQPTIKYFEGTKHGYVRAEVDKEQLRADFRYVSGIGSPTATIETGASFVVEAGHPGAQPA